MKEIPELLLKCCGKTRKPHNIIFAKDCIKIIFFCPNCLNWINLDYKNGMKKILSDTDLDKQPIYKYLKK